MLPVLHQPRHAAAARRAARRLVDQLRVVGERGRVAFAHDHGVRHVALVHLDAVGVELVDLEGDRLAQLLAALLGLRRCPPCAPPCWRSSPRDRCESSRPSAPKIGPNSPIDLLARFDDLLADRRALGVVAVEQRRRRLPLQHQRQLPGQVEGVLDRGVGAEPVARRMAVDGVAHAEHAAGADSAWRACG